MTIQKFALATLGIASGLLLQAQPPLPDFTELKAYLNLTDGQVTSLHDLSRAQRDAGRAVSESLRTQHQTMNTAMRSGSTDAATINSAALAIKAGDEKMASIRSQYQAQAVASLTPAQQVKLKALTDAAALAPNIQQAAMLGLISAPGGMRGGGPGGAMFRRGGGPGGPGGPPPPAQQ